MPTDEGAIETLANQEYKWGFVTDIDADALPKGLNEDIVRAISKRKNEPEFMTDPPMVRQACFRRWGKSKRGCAGGMNAAAKNEIHRETSQQRAVAGRCCSTHPRFWLIMLFPPAQTMV